jgi:elongation factor Ts
MMDCKKALTESAGDFDKAVAWLRERGAALATKRSGRAAREGGVAVWTNDGRTSAAVVELNCETDFVARNPDFVAMLLDLTKHLGTFGGSADSFKSAAYEGTTVEEFVKASVGRIGENIVLNRATRIDGKPGSRVYSYVHPPYKIAVAMELSIDGTPSDEAKLDSVGKDICLHIASAAPQYLVKDEVPQAVIDSEKAIYRTQALNEGKPEAFVDKMIEGRLRKFFEQVVLTEQPFALDEKTTITKMLEATSKEIGAKLAIASYVRYQLGEASAAATTEE